MNTITVLSKTKKYTLIKVPNNMVGSIIARPKLTEKEALRIMRAGMKEYRQGKTKILKSFQDLER